MKQQQETIIASIKDALPAKSYAEAAKKIDDQVSKIQTAMGSSMAITEAAKEIKHSSDKQCDKIKGMEERRPLPRRWRNKAKYWRTIPAAYRR